LLAVSQVLNALYGVHSGVCLGLGLQGLGFGGVQLECLWALA